MLVAGDATRKARMKREQELTFFWNSLGSLLQRPEQQDDLLTVLCESCCRLDSSLSELMSIQATLLPVFGIQMAGR